MNPLSNNGIEPVMRGLEKRADERDPVPRRKRPAVRAETAEDDEDMDDEDFDEDDDADETEGVEED